MGPIKRVFSEGHRAFFLGAGLWGILSGLIWLGWLWSRAYGSVADLPGPAMAAPFWHAHEMVFGYAGAAVGGFFLTAVAGGRGRIVAFAAALWLVGRVAIWWSGALPPVLVAVLDLSFLTFLTARIVTQLIQRPKPQQVVFLVFLAALLASNLAVHLDWSGILPGATATGLRAGLLALCGLIAVLGGRVTPGFIRNAMHRQGVPEADLPQPTPKLDRVVVVLAIALPFSTPLAPVAATISTTLAVAHGARLARWSPTWARRNALIWSLILAQVFLMAGFALWGVSHWDVGSELAALHLLGIGAIGGMTIAVMSRAALGHCGRPLVAPRPAVWAYGLMALSAILRWLGEVAFDWQDPLYLLASVGWIAALALFLAGLAGALVQPRPLRHTPVPPADTIPARQP